MSDRKRESERDVRERKKERERVRERECVCVRESDLQNVESNGGVGVPHGALSAGVGEQPRPYALR